MDWKAHGYLILSKFFTGYGAGFATAMGVISAIDPSQLLAYNLAIYPCLSGMIFVFPQLSKTFLEASNKRV